MFGLSPLARTLEAALRDARDKKPRVRRSAVIDLGRHAASGVAVDDNRGIATADSARTELGRVLLEDSQPEVRREAALAIANAGALELTPALLKATSDPAPEVRQMALLALGEVQGEGPEVTQALEKFLDADGPAFRFQALLALSQLSPEAARPHLLTALKDADVEVAYLAVRLLEEHFLAGPPVAPEIVTAVRKLATHTSLRVKMAVGLALAEIDPTLSQPLLVAILNERQRIVDPEDEQRAIELVGEHSIRDALPGLRRRAFPALGLKGPFAWHATTSLARLGDAQAKRTILAGLTGWTRDKRNLAVAAAGVAKLAEAKPRLLALRKNARLVDQETLEEALARLG